MPDFREPRWGFVEIIIVFIGILLISLLFSMSDDLMNTLFSIFKMPDTLLSYFYFGFVVQFTATVSLVLLMTVGIHKAKLSDIGIVNVSIEKYIRYGLLGGAFLFVIIMLASFFINYLSPEVEPQVFEQMLRMITGNKDFVFLFIIGAVLAPLSEELFYRGMIYPVFRQKFGPIPAMIMAGIIFGLVHWDLWRTIPLAIGGMVLCYLYEKTNSIFVTTLAHGVWNGTMSLIVYYSIINI
ncbi:MAG TPA: type II CAAX endopeptidase family protein [Syntrophomonadaceae bacterium]|nr:type II CAAX endopeptidase family protein [Syntrophomonadaceae bacterium]